MNRAITGAWASGGGRKNKISLNQPISPQNGNGSLPPGSAAAAAAAASLEPPTDPSTAPNTPDGEAQLSDSEAKQQSSKRKARLTATSEQPPAATSKRRKAGRNEPGKGGASSYVTQPTTRLKDLGGVTKALDQVLELIAMPLCHPEIYLHTGVKPPRGVLLHGPPGCGKTMLAGALAGELNVPLLSISSPSIVSGTSGESEQTLRKLFEEAIQVAPCILFLDEIDSITPKRESAGREMERRIVAQILTLLDDLTWDKTQGKPVMVIGATNRPDALDPALRRAGRFDHEITLGVPDEDGREDILRVLCAGLKLSGDFDLRALAKATPGYVGADLVALTAAAGIRAVKRIFNELAESATDVMMEDSQPNTVTDGDMQADHKTEEDTLVQQQRKDAGEDEIKVDLTDDLPDETVTHATPSATLFEALPAALQNSAIAKFLRSNQTPLSAAQLERLRIGPEDFAAALPSIQPSSKREGFATVPEVTWADIGALEATREELEMSIVEPIKNPELFRAVGVSNSGGVLLWGPPGCGKTLLAKAVANESGANFISVKGPELLNKYVGESERAVRQVFARARTSSPCVIFFDELDALVPRRDDSLSESSSRVVNTLLTELDGLEARVQTYVIGATNRPDMIDPAMCRPGRLDKLLYVDLPDTEERRKILSTLTNKTPLQVDQDGHTAWISDIACDARCDGFSGADLAALVREASVLALRETIQRRKGESRSTVAQVTQQQQTQSGASFTAYRSAEVSVKVNRPHFLAALDKVQPSVGMAQRKKYNLLRSRLSGLPGGQGRSHQGDNQPNDSGAAA